MKSSRPRSRMLLALAVLTSSVLLTDVANSGDAMVEARYTPARDPWLQPFASTSIWNVPLGSNADYMPANLPYTKNQGNTTVYLMRTKASDLLQPILKVGSWRDRCSGTGYQGTSVHLPDGWQPKPVTETSTPNNASVFLQPDGRTLVNVGAAARCNPRGPLHANRPGDDNHITDLYGDGIDGAHGASRLSQLGGVIRPGELTGDEPIAHALNLLVWAEHLYWGGTKESSYRWPAASSDSYAGPDRYRGSNPQLRMGSLLALAPDATPTSVGVTTEVGRKLFDALQDYGAYVTDDTAWDATSLSVDDAAVGTFPWGAAEKADMARMVMELNIITNNRPRSIGGGGTPRQPLLPPLPNERLKSVSTSRLDSAIRVGPQFVVAKPVVLDATPVTGDAKPAAGGTVITDTFDDGPAALDQRTGPAWTAYGGRFRVDQGATTLAGGGGSVMALLDASTPHVEVASSVKLSPTRAAPGLAIRARDESNAIVLSLVVRDGHNRVSLHAVVDGEYTKLAELKGANLRLGQNHEVVLTANGRDLEVAVDGRSVLRHQLSDALANRFAGGTMHGLRMMRNDVADDGRSQWSDVTVSRV